MQNNADTSISSPYPNVIPASELITQAGRPMEYQAKCRHLLICCNETLTKQLCSAIQDGVSERDELESVHFSKEPPGHMLIAYDPTSIGAFEVLMWLNDSFLQVQLVDIL